MGGLGGVAFINLMYFLFLPLSFLIPSSSGLATVAMPIMAPLASFAEVPAQLVVTAYQSANGLVNLVTPTSAVVMGGLAIARVGYGTWLRFVWPVLIMLAHPDGRRPDRCDAAAVIARTKLSAVTRWPCEGRRSRRTRVVSFPRGGPPQRAVPAAIASTSRVPSSRMSGRSARAHASMTGATRVS